MTIKIEPAYRRALDAIADATPGRQRTPSSIVRDLIVAFLEGRVPSDLQERKAS